MSKQTRRSISITGDLYDAIGAYCLEHGETKSGLVERVMREYLHEKLAAHKSMSPHEQDHEAQPEAPNNTRKPSEPEPSLPGPARGAGNILSF